MTQKTNTIPMLLSRMTTITTPTTKRSAQKLRETIKMAVKRYEK